LRLHLLAREVLALAWAESLLMARLLDRMVASCPAVVLQAVLLGLDP